MLVCMGRGCFIAFIMALDSGAITQEEYNKLKKKIVERLDESIDVNEND